MKGLTQFLGVAVVLVAAAAYGGYWYRGNLQNRVLMPAYFFGDGTDQIVAAGTWSSPGNAPLLAPSTTRMICSHRTMICLVSTAMMGPPPGPPSFSIHDEIFEIVSWGEEGIATHANERDCVGSTLAVDRKAKRVTMNRRTSDVTSRLCKNKPVIDEALQLAEPRSP